MSEMLQSGRVAEIASVPSVGEAPQGIGMAVAFDWGLVVQIIAMPFVGFLLGSGSVSPLKGANLSPLVLALISWPFAILLGIFGEGVRRGWRWTRLVQIVANSLGFLGGLATLPSLWHSIQAGNYWPVVTSVILVIFSPLIAWRLSRPATGRWFRTVSSAQARTRHGGAWPWLILLWSIVGGVLQAIASLQR
ncbi:MAG: hypothetical protein ABI456_24965 [Ktedonobacteraceae bacterium]|nr:hypothetical protein [Chloroflexota bacterium]